MDTIEVMYNEIPEVLNIVNTGGRVVDKFIEDKQTCPLIGSQITLIKELGSGTVGTVFEIHISGEYSKKYVVKRIRDDDEKNYPENISVHLEFEGKKSFMEVAKLLEEKTDINYNAILRSNKIKPQTMVTDQDIIYMPFTIMECLLTEPRKYVSNGHDEHSITIPKGSYVCSTTSEYIISLLVSQFYRQKHSIHFIDTFAFSICFDDIYQFSEYMFMEKIDSDLKKDRKCFSSYQNVKMLDDTMVRDNVVDSITVQILHSIALYQQTYKIVHGDLHASNIFIDHVTDDMIWNGTKLLDVDYYQYILPSGTKISVVGGKKCPFIVKIGDWGFACKYSDPQVLNNDVIDTGMEEWIPNFYNKAYDVMQVIIHLFHSFPENRLLLKIISFIFKTENEQPAPTYINILLNKYFQPQNKYQRVKLRELWRFEHVDPLTILTSIAYPHLKEPQINRKTVVLGKFSYDF